jgi:hypothetical protein
MNDLFQQIYLPNAAKAPELQPTFQQVMSSAFNLENDVVNILDYLSEPTFQADQNFNFQSEFKAQQLPDDWMPILAKATSKPEFDFLLGKVQQEYKDKAVLAAGGWGGTVAAIGAGVLSPTIFIPFAGQSRGVKGFAEVLALASAGAGAQNGALFLNQETRTEAELYAGIAMDTLLMGMMGGAYLGLTGRARMELATDVRVNQSFLEVPDGPLDAPSSAATRKVQVDEVDIDLKVEQLDAQTIRVGSGPRGEDELVGIYASPIERSGSAKGWQIAGANVAENLRGKGVGVRAYETLVEHLFSKGESVVYSDFNLTPEAARIYEALERRGYIIVRNPSEIVEGGTGRIEATTDLPVFEVRPPPEDAARMRRQRVDDTGMVPNRGEEAIPDSRAIDAQPVGAQVTRSRNTLGAKPAPNRAAQVAMNALGRLSPSYRMLTQRFFPSLRDGIAKLDMSGIQQAGLDVVEGSARNGTVIERIRGYDYNIVKFAKTLDQNYYRYVNGTDAGFDFGSPAITQLKSMMGRLPNGKMNWAEYKDAVFDGLNTGEVPKEIADSVTAFKEFFENYTTRQKQYLAEMRAEGIEVEPLFKELMSDELGEGIEGYAHHIFSKQKLMENFTEFLDDFAGYNEKQLVEAFGKARSRYAKKRAKLEFERIVADMDPATISQRLDEVEADLEFLEEIPEWQTFRQERLDINRQAKDEGWSKEQLKMHLKELQDNLSPDVRQLQDDRKALMQTAKVLRNFGGDSAEKTAKLQAEIDKADELISDMFRKELPGIERVDLSIGKIQEQGDKALAQVTVGLKKMVAALNKRQAQMNKLLGSKRANTASRAKVAEQVEAAKARYDAMLVRLEDVEGRNIALDQRLSELQLIREEVIADATALVRKRAAKAEDLEDRLEKAAAKLLTPEERMRMRDQVEEEMMAQEAKFRMDWSTKGERSGDPLTTEAPDFREKSREMATMLHQKLMNTEVELSPAYRAVRQDARGAELLRVMKIPYEIKKKWLEKDVELVTRAYDRVMAPDLELWRAFDGSVNGKSVLGEMQEEMTEQIMRISNSKYVKLPKGWTDKASKFSDRVKKVLTEVGEADDIYLEASSYSNEAKPGFIELTPELRNQLNQSVQDAMKASKRDFDVAIQRLRATRAVPQDPGSLMWRGGKFVKNLNVTTMMGGVLTSSISDVARPIWRHGIQKTLGRGWVPFINKMNPQAKEFRLRSKEINQRIGLNLEPTLHSRAQGVFDLAEDSIDRTKLERGMTFLANKTGLIAMYDYWTAGMKTIAGNVVHATMAEYVPTVAKAWRDGVEPTGDVLQMRTYLRNMGLSDFSIHRIATQMEKPGGVENFSNGGVLPNLEAWDDMSAYQAYQAAILKEVNELIVTPGLERPNWTDENMAYSLVAQFKSFTFSSTSRMAMSGLQGNDPYLMQGVAFSLAFGALSYYTYALSAGGKTLEQANEMEADKWIWEAVKRSGVLGALSLGTDAASNVPGLTGQEPTIFTRGTGLLGVVLGPTYSQLDKMANVMAQSGTESEEQQARNLRSLRQIFVPYQNHFFFRQFFDRIGDAMIGG